MEAREYRPYAVVIALMICTAVVTGLQTEARLQDNIGVRRSLPDRVGEWKGSHFLFCQEPACLQSFPSSSHANVQRCPACGGALDRITLAEKTVLPADTEILKKEYTNRSGQAISVSVVFSGYEQKSIHRPQQCLPALGHVIEGGAVVQVPLEERAPLGVRILNLRRTMKTKDEVFLSSLSAYAYWFTDGEKETANHYHRLWLMSLDRIFRNRIRRWAYVAISSARSDHSDDHVRLLTEFVQTLHPLITK